MHYNNYKYEYYMNTLFNTTFYNIIKLCENENYDGIFCRYLSTFILQSHKSR